MKLYMYPDHQRAIGVRSNRVLWMIEELGIPCEFVGVDLSKGEQKRPEYLAVHPHGVVPALVDGDQTILESGAIVLYLADKHPEKKLAPAPGSPARAKYYQWAVYGPAEIDSLLGTIVLHTRFLPENQRNPEAAKQAKEKFRTCAQVLTTALEGSPYLLGTDFSAADIIIGHDCAWAVMAGVLAEYPKLVTYLGRLQERPAFKKVYGSIAARV